MLFGTLFIEQNTTFVVHSVSHNVVETQSSVDTPLVSEVNLIRQFIPASLHPISLGLGVLFYAFINYSDLLCPTIHKSIGLIPHVIPSSRIVCLDSSMTGS